MSSTTSRTRSEVRGLVRVTVTSNTRRVDLVLPAAVPVADLTPELARSVGLLEPATVHQGYDLVTREGRVLVADRGLSAQGVVDGAVITVVAGVDGRSSRLYDDVVEAMSDAVERQLSPWGPDSARRTSTSVAVLALLVALGSLLLQHGSRSAVVIAIALAALLVPGAVVRSRVRTQSVASVPTTVTAALLGCVYASGAALLIAWDSDVAVSAMTAAGAGALVAGSVAALGLAEGRVHLLPPVVVGAVLLTAGLLTQATSLGPAVVLTTTVTVVVGCGGWFPALALATTRTQVDQLYRATDIAGGPGWIDPDRVAADARIAHQILLAVSTSVGVLLVLVAPFAVSLGVAGTLVVVVGCLVVLLRTRHHRCRSEVLCGVISGVLGLLSIAVSAVWLHPSWRTPTVLCLASTGAALMISALGPHRGSVRLSRLADGLETVGTLVLAPALVVASGLFSWLHR